MTLFPRMVCFGLITLSPGISALRAQERDTTLVIGQRYRAGALHRWIFGSEYRQLWTAPTKVRVVDLRRFGGGLTPISSGGSRQTKSLWFRGGDGYQYGFRSVDKDPGLVSSELEGTIVDRLVQDQTSSAHPAGPAIAAVLMAATGVLHTSVELVVLPDDAALDTFRMSFAGVVGYIQRRPIVQEGVPPFAGALEIIESEDLMERVTASPLDRVDARALLVARLIDILMGDFDRHRGQWTWARFANGSPRVWVPLPEDRDQAFARYDGVALAIARIQQPELTNFGKDYGSIFGLSWVGRELDRRFLSELDRPTWDSVVSAMQEQLTDSVLLAATAAMPPAMQALDAGRTLAALRARRDNLPQAADQFFHMHAREVDIHATDQGDNVFIEQRHDGTTELTIRSRTPGSVPYVHRQFQDAETKELRIYLYGGADSVVLRGTSKGPSIRLVGGSGTKRVIDDGIGARARYYGPTNVALPASVGSDDRTFVPPSDDGSRTPRHRDWGARWTGMGLVGFSPDYGLLISGGADHTDYGFRFVPNASTIRLRGSLSSRQTSGRATVAGILRRSNSKVRVNVNATLSRIEVLYFHGFGNETGAPQRSQFYRVDQILYGASGELVVPVVSRLDLAIGIDVKRSHTREVPGTLLTDSLFGMYGAGVFSQAGGTARLALDTRDHPHAATHGVVFELGASSYPKLLSVDRTPFTAVHATAATYLTASRAPLRPTLAVRAGGRKVFGQFPFYESAFIGDAETTRLGRKNRFAGDGAAWGSGELRMRVSRVSLILPGEFGVFGLAEVGRVFLRGESSRAWHRVYGGGVWISFLSPDNTLTASFAAGEERRTVYVQAGFAF